MEDGFMRCVLCSLPDKEKGSAYLALDFLISYALKNERIRNEVEIYRLDIDKNDSPTTIFSKIIKEDPDVLGFSCYLWNLVETLNLCKHIKDVIPNVKIILGGPEVSFISQQILIENNFVDVIVRGEGEITFTEILLSLLTNGITLENIKGTTFRRDDNVFSTDDRELINDLDEIPSPLINLPTHCDDIALQFNRGCIYNCNYCTWPGANFIRSFSPERIKEDLEIAFSKEPKRITIYDSGFNVPHNRLREIACLLGEVDRNIPLTIQCEVNFVNEEQIDLFKQLNIRYLEIGLQTANKDTLSVINKKINIEEFERKIKLLNKAENISYSIDLIWGLPGDNFSKFKHSIEYVYGILGADSIILFHLLRVLPGSHFWKFPDKYNIIWEKLPPHRIISNNTYSEKEIKETSVYVKEMVSKNPWMKLFTEVDLKL